MPLGDKFRFSANLFINIIGDKLLLNFGAKFQRLSTTSEISAI